MSRVIQTIALGFLGLNLVCRGTAQTVKIEDPQGARMVTKWAKDVSSTHPLPEYPRPQLVRKRWESLNGMWNFALTPVTQSQPPAEMAGKILVPFPFESALSKVAHLSVPDQKLWYRRAFTIPVNWKGDRVLLNFGAVNYTAVVHVNGHEIGSHRGGFDSFSFDITDALKEGENEILVAVQNPLRSDVADAQVLGKQRLHPEGIFYTAATGIWQTVWLEPVPTAHLDSLKIVPDIDHSMLTLKIQSSQVLAVKATVLDDGHEIATVSGNANSDLTLSIPHPKLWSPESPHLYNLKVELGSDHVDSYFAMRKISLGKDESGRATICLNNKPYFEIGALDQGYWPDGIYTAPSDHALESDIVTAKSLGFNLLRKHAKVEPARWYYHADKLGMLVWQDMPQMFGPEKGTLSDDAKKQFANEWEKIIANHFNSPSIVVWTTFNEGWGQHDTPEIVDLTRRLDPSRLVNNASGWVDKKVGDINDAHAYPGPWSELPEATRAAVNGEFGGVTLSVTGHRWNMHDVMGYGSTLNSSWKATKNYQNLLKKAYALKESHGTSAFVYTQITDVEQEINGILTYDRSVTKLDPTIVAAANRGVFLPLGPDPYPQLVPTSEDAGIVWKYATQPPAENWFTAAYDDSNWPSGPGLFGHDIAGVRTPWTSSDIWIRRQFTLNGTIPHKLVLVVRHDEDAEIYVNGVLAGSVTGYNTAYGEIPMSDVAKAALKQGDNTLAVHCHQTVGGQGIDVGISVPYHELPL